MNLLTIDDKLYLPGAASLLEQLDKQVLLILRDGRHLVGTLRSFDQFLNLVLESTFERLIVSGGYCDVPLGLYIVRGDNIVILGEVDDKGSEEEQLERNFKKFSPEELADLGDEMRLDPSKVLWDFE